MKLSASISGQFLLLCKRSIFISIIRSLEFRLLIPSPGILCSVRLSLKIFESKSKENYVETMEGSSPSCSSGWTMIRLLLSGYFELHALISYVLMGISYFLCSRTTLVWVEIRGLVFSSSVLENSLVACVSLTLEFSIVSAWLTNSNWRNQV